MKCILIFTTISLIALGGEKKPLPGQAGNDDVELVGSVIVDHDVVTNAVGEDMGPGYVLVRMKVTPKTQKPLSISPDDFTIISRKDGQRSQALSPGQIAGSGALVVKAAINQPGGEGTTTNGPIWGGVVPRMGGRPKANDNSDSGAVGMKDDKDKAKDNPLMAALKAKELPEKESLEPVEGLLYFPIDGKIKPKDLAMIYKGPAGRLTMEFANSK